MQHVLALVLLIAVLFFGSAGWGVLATDIGRHRRAQRAGAHAGADAETETEIGFALQVAVGAALFMAVGGVLVALDIAWVGLLVLWHAVGCGVLVLRMRRRARAGPERVPVYRRPLVWAMGLAGAAGTVVALGNVFGANYNANDDLPAYMYLAQRLVSTGGLIDPFNLRRTGGYGASTLYQALFLRLTGPTTLEGFEFGFGVLVTLVLVVGTTRRRGLVLGTVLAGLSLLVAHSFGVNVNVYAAPLPVANLGPEFSATALSLASFQLAARLRSGGGGSSGRVAVYLGLVLAGLFAVRFTFLPAAAVAAAVALVVLAQRRIRTAAVTVGTLALASAGWALASYRSSGTPLIAVVAGNYDSTYLPARDPHVRSLAAYADRFWEVFQFNDLGWVMVTSAALAVVVGIGSRRLRSRAVVLFGAALGCAVQLAVLNYQFSGAFYPDIARFEAPSVLACALFAFWMLWPERAAATSMASAPPHAARATRHRRPVRVVRWLSRPAVVVVSMTAAAGLLWALTFGDNVSYQAQEISREWARGGGLLDRSASRRGPVPARRAPRLCPPQRPRAPGGDGARGGGRARPARFLPLPVRHPRPARGGVPAAAPAVVPRPWPRPALPAPPRLRLCGRRLPHPGRAVQPSPMAEVRAQRVLDEPAVWPLLRTVAARGGRVGARPRPAHHARAVAHAHRPAHRHLSAAPAPGRLRRDGCSWPPQARVRTLARTRARASPAVAGSVPGPVVPSAARRWARSASSSVSSSGARVSPVAHARSRSARAGLRARTGPCM